MARPVIPTSDQITPIILDRSIPAFINDYYPQFVAFLQAYYEFLEQSMNHTKLFSTSANTAIST